MIEIFIATTVSSGEMSDIWIDKYLAAVAFGRYIEATWERDIRKFKMPLEIDVEIAVYDHTFRDNDINNILDYAQIDIISDDDIDHSDIPKALSSVPKLLKGFKETEIGKALLK